MTETFHKKKDRRKTHKDQPISTEPDRMMGQYLQLAGPENIAKCSLPHQVTEVRKKSRETPWKAQNQFRLPG